MFATVSAVLAVVSAGSAAFVVLDPFGGTVADAADAGGGTADAAEDSTAEDGPVDLTEGLDPFDPFANDDYYGFTWHELAWIPPAPTELWEVEHHESTRSVTFSRVLGDDDRSHMSCSDIRNSEEHYPTTFDDPAAWYEGEVDRYTPSEERQDRYEVSEGPTYSSYLIDGRDTVVVEYAHHWTQWEDSDGEIHSVDYTWRHALIFIDLPTDRATAEGPVNTARCKLSVQSPDDAVYREALDLLLGIRLWLE